MKQIKSLALLLMTAMIWGFAFVTQKMGADHVGTFTFIGARFIIGAMSLIPVILIFEKKEEDIKIHNKKTTDTFKIGIVAGVILFIASSLQQVGIEITGSAGKASFLTGLYAVLVPIFGIFLGKRTSFNVWIGAFLAVAGMFLICVNDKFVIGRGDDVLLVCAVFYTFHILVIDKFVNKLYAIRFAGTQFAVCGVLGIVCALIFETIYIDEILNALIPILYCGVMSSGVAYTCQIIGQKNADPTYASIILSTESMFGAIGGAIILHEVMTGRGYVGCALIFAGVIISQLVFKKKSAVL